MDDMQSEVQHNAELEHDAKCHRGRNCSARDWHVRNDYFHKAVTAMQLRKIEEHETVMALLRSL